jgi:hypothetical protein
MRSSRLLLLLFGLGFLLAIPLTRWLLMYELIKVGQKPYGFGDNNEALYHQQPWLAPVSTAIAITIPVMYFCMVAGDILWEVFIPLRIRILLRRARRRAQRNHAMVASDVRREARQFLKNERKRRGK